MLLVPSQSTERKAGDGLGPVSLYRHPRWLLAVSTCAFRPTGVLYCHVPQIFFGPSSAYGVRRLGFRAAEAREAAQGTHGTYRRGACVQVFEKRRCERLR